MPSAFTSERYCPGLREFTADTFETNWFGLSLPAKTPLSEERWKAWVCLLLRAPLTIPSGVW